MKRKLAYILSFVDDRYIDEADPTKNNRKGNLTWRKWTAIAACICILTSAITLGILIPILSGNSFKKGIISPELISLSKNAQYLPSRELLVSSQKSTHSRSMMSASASRWNSDVSPRTLLDGGFTEEEYENLIEIISPIDTPYNREFTVLDAKDEVTKILSKGVLFDEWFSYAEGELQGQGRYFVTNKDGVLTITRLSTFQPRVFDSASGKFSNYDTHNPNLRSDDYLKIRIYTQDGKEVVECEAVTNLYYYGKVTPVLYQYIRNVKDTSFTKIIITSRDQICESDDSTGWGYDIDTDLPYGYKRSFTQIDYSSPNDITWLSAEQELPYAFCLKSDYLVEYGRRSEDGGFYYLNNFYLYDVDDFSYTPNTTYLSLQNWNIHLMMSFAYAFDGDNYVYTDLHCSDAPIPIQLQELFNEKITNILSSLKTLAKGETVPTDNENFDCTSENADFEKLIFDYFNLTAKVSIDGSSLAKDNLNSNIYEITPTKVLPSDYIPPDSGEEQ